MRRIFALPLLSCLAACGNVTPGEQAEITQELIVACAVDGTLVPLAQPVVAAATTGGAAAANADSVLAHPAVVAACNTIDGTPASAKPMAAPATTTTSPNG
jgi:predicted small secreted protein